MGAALVMISASPIARIGIITANAIDIFGLVMIAIIRANTSIIGHRTAVRIIIMNAICTLETSVVIRVTRLDVENLSMLEKE